MDKTHCGPLSFFSSHGFISFRNFWFPAHTGHETDEREMWVTLRNRCALSRHSFPSSAFILPPSLTHQTSIATTEFQTYSNLMFCEMHIDMYVCIHVQTGQNKVHSHLQAIQICMANRKTDYGGYCIGSFFKKIKQSQLNYGYRTKV